MLKGAFFHYTQSKEVLDNHADLLIKVGKTELSQIMKCPTTVIFVEHDEKFKGLINPKTEVIIMDG